MMPKHTHPAGRTLPAIDDRDVTPLPHQRKSATYLAAKDLNSILPCHGDEEAGRHEHLPARRREAVARKVGGDDRDWRGRRRRGRSQGLDADGVRAHPHCN